MTSLKKSQGYAPRMRSLISEPVGSDFIFNKFKMT